MAFNFSMSNGFDAKDIVKFIYLPEDTELAPEDCKPILLVDITEPSSVLTVNLEEYQGIVVINLSDEYDLALKDAKMSDDNGIIVPMNSVVGAALYYNAGDYYFDANN